MPVDHPPPTSNAELPPLFPPLHSTPTSSSSTSPSLPADGLSEALQNQARISPQTAHPLAPAIEEPRPSAEAIAPAELGARLGRKAAPLLIDTRSYDEYEQCRIRDSINVNLPTLLVKRYKRGTISTFNLDSFIATDEGKRYYAEWERMRAQSKTTHDIVIYDETMQVQTDEIHAWILVAVLQKLFVGVRVLTLQGGFEAFRRWDTEARHLIPRSHLYHQANKHHWPPPIFENTLKLPPPMQSRSATTRSITPIDTSNVQRRASLFSLDTSGPHSAAPHLPKRRMQRSFEKDNTLTCIGEKDTPSLANDVSEVLKGFLFLGPEPSGTPQIAELHAYHIRRVLNMAEELDDDIPGLKESFRYHKIAAKDTVDMQGVEKMLRRAVIVIGNKSIYFCLVLFRLCRCASM